MSRASRRPTRDAGVNAPVDLGSPDNPVLRRVRRLVHDGNAYRRLGQVWLEGEHLCAAVVAAGWPMPICLVREEAWQEPALRALAQHATRVLRLPQRLFDGLGGLPSPAGIGCLVDLPPAAPMAPDLNTLILDRVQDAGNVGSVMRSAAALGVPQVLALSGTAALWSPKVVRAAMGAHFSLRLIEGLSEDDLQRLPLPLVAADAHAPTLLTQSELPHPCAWVLGHEGQGLSPSLLQRCAQRVRIPQPGGQESLNVAAAAAVCLYESLRQRSRQ